MAHRYGEHVPRTVQKYRPSAPSATIGKRKASSRSSLRPPPVPSTVGPPHRLGVGTIGGAGLQDDCSFLEVKDLFFTNLVLLGFNPLLHEEKYKMAFNRLGCSSSRSWVHPHTIAIHRCMTELLLQAWGCVVRKAQSVLSGVQYSLLYKFVCMWNCTCTYVLCMLLETQDCEDCKGWFVFSLESLDIMQYSHLIGGKCHVVWLPALLPNQLTTTS